MQCKKKKTLVGWRLTLRLKSWPRGVAERQLEGGSKEKTEAAEQETPGRLGESSWQSRVPLSRSSLRGQRLLALGVLSTLRGSFHGLPRNSMGLVEGCLQDKASSRRTCMTWKVRPESEKCNP